ncbi:hypothetical protein PENTCL1PPCAC_27948, partial [Pristionchus entomophagus]
STTNPSVTSDLLKLESAQTGEMDQWSWSERIQVNSYAPNGYDAYNSIGGTRNFRGFDLFRQIVLNPELE